MNIFRLSPDDEEELQWKKSFMTLVCIEPTAVPLKKSCVPTCPLGGVTFILIQYKYFKYLN
jgi:hypothetical protein